jgi:hypothetical protein
MLTDIFAHRYKNNRLWQTFTTSEQVLLVQAYRIFSEQVGPYKADGSLADSKSTFDGVGPTLAFALDL